MAEAWFYHLTDTALEAAAPEILEKCLARGWRVCLRAGSTARVSALNLHLWTYREEGFLPHGAPEDGFAQAQPIYLTAGRETPNAPHVLMLVDGAAPDVPEFGSFERVVLMFDDADAPAKERARAAWREVASGGMKAVYWAQDGGRWVKRAESGGG
ncbi:DNA polymerase III subunit chi [uncultured Albimonas sp.]|uniref:DNA polymerase III subunit chi n=1 Tax=uncultured Albimonas sp. TaxID=1331701 RepID=UPI0030EF7B97